MRWVREYGNLIYQICKEKNEKDQLHWKLDETYIKIKGEWDYLYRAIDKKSIYWIFNFVKNRINWMPMPL
ncbi:Transposase [Bacillus thuringiensis serovar monterrey BGSC 4AJ1]|nr:Transposase [Bacillus thuringiensis serovar monterrey BGSC 4AJ1]